MHKITYKKWKFDYIDSSRVPELFEKMQKKQVIMVWKNIRDTFNIVDVVELTKDEEMIYNLLKNENEYINSKVEYEISIYNWKITPWVIKAMIIKYKK